MLVIVTGASRGIGFEIVKELTKNPKNLVIAVSRNPASLNKIVQQSNTHNLLPVKASVGTRAGIATVVKAVKALDMPLDILINNAGEILNKPFSNITEKELHSVYNTNVFAPFLLSQALLPVLRKAIKPHIVNIGSMGGYQGSLKFAGLSAYSSSKGALANLSECMAEDLKSDGITVNCLALGSVQTEMLNLAFPKFRAPLAANQMAEFICDFSINGNRFFNGKILPVSITTP